jgi:hypothetical protein
VVAHDAPADAKGHEQDAHDAAGEAPMGHDEEAIPDPEDDDLAL